MSFEKNLKQNFPELYGKVKIIRKDCIIEQEGKRKIAKEEMNYVKIEDLFKHCLSKKRVIEVIDKLSTQVVSKELIAQYIKLLQQKGLSYIEAEHIIMWYTKEIRPKLAIQLKKELNLCKEKPAQDATPGDIKIVG